MLDNATITALARHLYEARKTRTQLRHFSKQYPGMTVEDMRAGVSRIRSRWWWSMSTASTSG